MVVAQQQQQQRRKKERERHFGERANQFFHPQSMFPPPLLWLLFISKSRVLIFNAPLAWAQTLMNKPQLNAS